jgi:hypothetical protein
LLLCLLVSSFAKRLCRVIALQKLRGRGQCSLNSILCRWR